MTIFAIYVVGKPYVHNIRSTGMHFVFIARCVRWNESSRYCHDVRPSARLSATGVHCDYTVHFSVDLSSQFKFFNVLGMLTQKHVVTYSQPSFSTSIWNRGGAWMCKLGIDVNTNIDK